MPNENLYKIGPRLRRYLDQAALATYSDPSGCTCWIDPATGSPSPAPVNPQAPAGDRYARAFIEVNDLATVELVRRHEAVREFVHVVEGYCTALVRLDRLEALADLPGVLEIDGVQYCRPLLDGSVNSINGWKGMPKGDPERQIQGAGVVIGIVDYGLDFRLNDFRDMAGHTRIKFLWDQQLKAGRNTEKPPAKYGYGVEYTAGDIDLALKAPDPFAVVRHQPLDSASDVSGHGTHVAGIAAGSGRTYDGKYPADTYVGVAPGSDIVFVHLNRKAITSQITSPDGTLANSINLAHAIAYCFEKAEQLGKPCVVNLSMGFHGGGHDGNMPVEWIIDALLRKSGRAVVVAAGNEHRQDKQIYYRGSVRQHAAPVVEWDVGIRETNLDGSEYDWGDPTANEVEIWYSKESRLTVQLIAPDGETSGDVAAGPAVFKPFTYREGEVALISSYERTAWDGDACIHIQLNPGGAKDWIRYGTWRIVLQATTLGPAEKNGVRFDGWIERTLPITDDRNPQFQSRFPAYDASSAITLTTLGTARSAITVASFDDTRRGKPVSEFSSRGPTRDERECKKPELAAPGQWLRSSNAGAGRGNPPAPARVEMEGTSMSAPHVTGVVARLLGRQQFLYADEIREILVATARHPRGRKGWKRDRGYGNVDAAAAMKLLEERLNAKHAR